MTTRTKRWLRGSVAAIAAAFLAVGGATASHAAPIIPGADEVGNLFIVKHETPAAGEGDGLPLPAAPTSDPVPGVVFTAVQLDPAVYDLSTNAGWAALAALNGDTDAAEAVLSPAAGDTHVSAATDVDGETSFANLPIGAYLVTETSYPAGVTPAAPFLVTLPMTDPNNLDNWLYDVYVYPKNATVPPPVKTVTDATAIGLGSPVNYTITAEIPDLDSPATLDFYALRDTMPAQLTLTALPTVTLSGAGAPALTLGTHYTVSPATVPAVGADLIVKFTSTGLAVLDANSDRQVQLGIATTVNSVPANGIISNTPVLFPNLVSWGDDPDSDTPDPGNPGTPGTPVETRWGSIQLTKTDASDDSPLGGAVFRVYATEADAEAQTNPITTGTPGASTWTTDGAGLLTITGLRYSDWENGAPDASPRTYYLVEIEAPDGYELLARPIPVVVDAPIVEVDVENSPKNGGFQLPFTGATGQWLFPVGGALLLGGAALILVARNRRHRTA